MADVEGSRARAYRVAKSESDFNTGSKHPVDGSLGPEEGTLHWAAVPARTWFRLQSETARSFHGDGWIDIVRANSIHSNTLDLRTAAVPVPRHDPTKRRKYGQR